MPKRRLNLFLIDGGGWSGTVDWTDGEERERLAELVSSGHYDASEKMFVPARSIVRAAITYEDDEVLDS